LRAFLSLFSADPLILMIMWPFNRLIRKGFEKSADSLVTDPLAADGKPVDMSWAGENEAEKPMKHYQVEIDLTMLKTFLLGMQHSFDRGLSESQTEVICNRVGGLRIQKNFCSHYNIMHQGEVTNLEISVHHDTSTTYILNLRGSGAAMTVMHENLQKLGGA
jgi:hypothetical protein